MKRPRHLAQAALCLGFASLFAGLAGLAHAHSDPSNSSAAEGGGLESHNRQLQAAWQRSEGYYREIDTQGLTPDGTFNTESGALQGAAAQLRWQGHIASLPLFAQLQAAKRSGHTRYQGYLQSGTSLTPYNAHTGNSIRSYGLSLGLPLPLPAPADASATPAAWQLTPLLHWRSSRWQRNLVQYGERYQSQGLAWGAMAQWRISPSTVLEASHLAGSHKQSIHVNAFGFAASLPQSRWQQSSASISHRFAPSWSGQLSISQERLRNGESAFVSSPIGLLQAPPATSRQRHILLALGWHY